MRIVFSRLARYELDDTTDYYNGKQAGLGNEFREAIRDSALQIVRQPTAWAVERGEIRRYVLHRFPYKILYSIEPDHLFIIAIAHQHRKPNYWVDTI